jgi:hypothetical protein
MIGIIYKIKCNITNEIYIGSTTDFYSRHLRHIDLKHNKTCKSKQIIERNNYNFYILDKREFPNNLSLLLLENLYIIICKKYCNCINGCLAYRTKLYKTHYKKMYFKNNKIRIDEKRKILINCNLCNKMIRKDCITKHQKSRNCINNNFKTERIICNFCNCKISKNTLRRHQNSNWCLKNRSNQ